MSPLLGMGLGYPLPAKQGLHPHPRHPHLPLRFLYASAAPPEWPNDPVDGYHLCGPDGPAPGQRITDLDIETLAIFEVLDQRRAAPLVQLRLTAYERQDSAPEQIMTFRRTDTGAHPEDEATRFVCVDRKLRAAFELQPELPSAAEVMAMLKRIQELEGDFGAEILSSEYGMDIRPDVPRYLDWVAMGAPWDAEWAAEVLEAGEGEVEPKDVEIGGDEALRRLCRLASTYVDTRLAHASDFELILSIAEQVAKVLVDHPFAPEDCRAFWADAVWACRANTHIGKLPREVFELIAADVPPPPLIVPWLFWEE
ncbi:hypothetical protein BDK51DRAFT_51311 [Blyttiomyces helicus]|uniref:Uncharacterized protein n=1 Tax=Blyttiomyces helicus TaxID=388810 RepID=A0A4P9W3P4_9FUNG|nr:hypothetical protein BDK51DRAFT_51311 [Blyttiomyces helicus]|eukprot:RKO85915.1 hypothetical protein BDK51DRAFT_51311 [Blyttiomyces helicus]